MLLLARMLAELGTVREPVVIDHFEAFEVSQDLPFGIGTVVGHRSWFVYGLDPAIHGRGGKVTELQRARLAMRKTRERQGGYKGSFTPFARYSGRIGARRGSDPPHGWP